MQLSTTRGTAGANMVLVVHGDGGGGEEENVHRSGGKVVIQRSNNKTSYYTQATTTTEKRKFWITWNTFIHREYRNTFTSIALSKKDLKETVGKRKILLHVHPNWSIERIPIIGLKYARLFHSNSPAKGRTTLFALLGFLKDKI